jgi:hypothetical protein
MCYRWMTSCNDTPTRTHLKRGRRLGTRLVSWKRVKSSSWLTDDLLRLIPAAGCGKRLLLTPEHVD